MTGIKSAISAIAVHPKKKLIAAAGSEGFIVFWDYEKCGELVFNQYEHFNPKERENTRDRDENGGEKQGPQAFFTAMCFTPNGDDLLVGDYKGVIRIVDPTNAEYKKTSMELKTSDSDHGKFLTYMKVSEDGKYFATADT